MLKEDGHVKSPRSIYEISYVKRTDANEKFTLERFNGSFWRIYHEAGYDALALYQNDNKDKFKLGRPKDIGRISIGHGASPHPTARLIGLVFVVGHDRHTLEHAVTKWILNNDLLELVAKDLNSADSHTCNGADKAIKSMLILLHELLCLVEETPCKGESINNAVDIECTQEIAQRLMQNILLLTNKALESIESSITKL
jgi:hypothetical protein